MIAMNDSSFGAMQETEAAVNDFNHKNEDN
jgi:hypothetical protein